MHNIHVISTEDSVLVEDAVRSMEVIYDPEQIEDLMHTDVSAPDAKRRVEHRCHRRFQLNGVAFAIIRSIAAKPLQIIGKSMGSIGCAVYNSKPARLGEIDNISMGGLMFHHIGNKPQLSKAPVLDILLAEYGFYLAGIRYKTITDAALTGDGPGDPVDMWQVRLQFQNLNRNQFSELKDFILNYGAENGETGTKE